MGDDNKPADEGKGSKFVKDVAIATVLGPGLGSLYIAKELIQHAKEDPNGGTHVKAQVDTTKAAGTAMGDPSQENVDKALQEEQKRVQKAGEYEKRVQASQKKNTP